MSGVAAVFYRDWRQRMTNVGIVFWDLFVPLAYLMLFGQGFERMIGGGVSVGAGEVGYTAFLLPGVLAMVSFSVALNTSWGFFVDKDSGIFYEMLTYPITRQQILVGKIAFNVLTALVGSLLAVAVGVVAMEVPVRVSLLPLTVAVVVVATAGWFFVFSVLAISLHRMDAYNTVTSAAYILVMFLSSMFYPLDEVPTWFRVIAYANPMTWQVDLFRYATLGVGAVSTLAWEAVGLVVFAALGLAAAVRTLNRAG